MKLEAIEKIVKNWSSFTHCSKTCIPSVKEKRRYFDVSMFHLFLSIQLKSIGSKTSLDLTDFHCIFLKISSFCAAEPRKSYSVEQHEVE